MYNVHFYTVETMGRRTGLMESLEFNCCVRLKNHSRRTIYNKSFASFRLK